MLQDQTLAFCGRLVQLASFKQSLHQFSAAFEQAGMKIRTKKDRCITSRKEPKPTHAASMRQYTAACRDVQVNDYIFGLAWSRLVVGQQNYLRLLKTWRYFDSSYESFVGLLPQLPSPEEKQV